MYLKGEKTNFNILFLENIPIVAYSWNAQIFDN